MGTYIGIDIGSEEHAVYAITKESEVPASHFTVTNDGEGFEKLEEFLGGAIGSILLGLEMTGNYWKPVFVNYIFQVPTFCRKLLPKHLSGLFKLNRYKFRFSFNR